MKKISLIIMLLMLLALPMWSCSGSDGSNEETVQTEEAAEYSDDEMENPENEELHYSDVAYEEEDDEADLQKVKTDLSKYYGDWTALSGRAEFLYGNVDMTINEDGTYKANITGEILKGKWTDEGDYIRCHNDLFSFSLAFDKGGKLIFINDENEDDINIVMTRK